MLSRCLLQLSSCTNYWCNQLSRKRSDSATRPAILSRPPFFCGGSFSELKRKFWDSYGSHVKSRAVKIDGVWSAEQPDAADWARVMQLKLMKHVVDSTKTDQAWHQWLVKTRGQTVTLLIYEFGTGISRAQDLEAFKAACILLELTDRAGATADVCLRDIVANLQEECGSTFQGAAVVWRIWGNHITRNLNRSTWTSAIEQPPPNYVANLLRPADSPLEKHISSITQSANMALEFARGSLEGYQQLRRDIDALGRRGEEHEHQLVTRRDINEAFLHDIAPPSPDRCRIHFSSLKILRTPITSTNSVGSIFVLVNDEVQVFKFNSHREEKRVP